jgi:hypothetical protein
MLKNTETAVGGIALARRYVSQNESEVKPCFLPGSAHAVGPLQYCTSNCLCSTQSYYEAQKSKATLDRALALDLSIVSLIACIKILIVAGAFFSGTSSSRVIHLVLHITRTRVHSIDSLVAYSFPLHCVMFILTMDCSNSTKGAAHEYTNQANNNDGQLHEALLGRAEVSERRQPTISLACIALNTFGSKKAKKDLPADFAPNDFTVIMGRGNSNECPGNRRLRSLVQSNLQQYLDAPDKLGKSLIVSRVVEIVKENSPVAGFVKYEKGRWVDVGERTSREKGSGQYVIACLSLNGASGCSPPCCFMNA